MVTTLGIPSFFFTEDFAFSSKNSKMDIMDPQWRSRKAERLSGSGHGRLNSYSPSRQTRVPPYAPVLCPLGASSRVHRRSHTRRHGIRPQQWPEMLIVYVLPDPDSPKTGIDAAAAEFSLSSSAAAGRGFLVFCASPFDVLLRSRPPRRSEQALTLLRTKGYQTT